MVTDDTIIGLFNARNETALQLTREKYGSYCMTIARNILNSVRDAEECENETLFKIWNAIPPARPKNLKAYIGKITRNTALDAYEQNAAAKRGGGQAELALSEIEEFTGDAVSVEKAVENREVSAAINRFLSRIPKQQRVIFLRRYLYFSSIGEIAAGLGISESKVKSVLFRVRGKLKTDLEKEGIMP